ncbi:glycosyl transferase family 2 [Duganella sp. Root198D2]|nr:glycosyl transferase family 2 [Duganella sp. Root198D2]
MENVGAPLGIASEGPKVAILLGTFRGQEYLAEQLDSFAAQTHSNWEVWASDDGSTDNTLAILALFKDQWPPGRLSVLAGPAKGFVSNFLALTCNSSIQADYYAYSDQDDIWEADKLERALEWLESVPADAPALYCARTRLVDSNNREIGFSPLFGDPRFANALVQSIAGGNTMVFNNAARALLLQAGPQIPVVYHDWWLYMAVTGCGGKVFFDPVPTLRYRQHEANVVGVNSSWQARFQRMRKLWQGQHRKWYGDHIAALRRLEDRLTPENREILNQFAQAREKSLIPRLVHLRRSGVSRQTGLGNIALFAAAIFNKL